MNTKTVVACYTLDGKYIRTYKSARDASRCLHLHPRTIERCIRGEISIVKSKRWIRCDIDNVPKSISPLDTSIKKTLNIKPIALIDESDNIIKTYPSISKASKDNNTDPKSIRDVLSNRYRYAKGKRYRYLSDLECDIYKYKRGRYIGYEKNAVIQLSLSGTYIHTFKSVYEAGKYLHKSPAGIYNCFKGKSHTAYGYKWRYKSTQKESKDGQS